MPVHLILVLPSPNSRDYPLDINRAESKFGGVFDYCSPDRLTLLKVPYEDSPGEEVPMGIKEMLESRNESDLAESAEVLKITAIDPYAPNWNPEDFFMSYFEPLVRDSNQGQETVFFIGPGTAFLTALMTQLAVSIDADLLTNTPYDEDETCSVRSLNFVSKGVTGYRSLFDNKPLGNRPREKTRKTRNVLVKLLENNSFNDRWSSARQLCGGKNLPETLGLRHSIRPLCGALVMESESVDGMKYSLTPAGVVAAIEARKHHTAVFGIPYHSDSASTLMNPDQNARGVITGLRLKNREDTFGESESNENANGLTKFNPISLILSHASIVKDSGFREHTSPAEVSKVFKQRDKEILNTHLSVCGPDWDPEAHFISVIELISSLPDYGVDWHLDVTRLISQDQIIFSLACHLFELPIIYRSVLEGTGARGRIVEKPPGWFSSDIHQHSVPIYSAWRSIHDLVIHGDPKTELMVVLESMTNPDDTLSKSDFDRIVSTQLGIDEPIAKSRVRDKLLKNNLFADEGSNGWKLTPDGRVVWAFLDARR